MIIAFIMGLLLGIILTFIFLKFTLGKLYYPPVKKNRR